MKFGQLIEYNITTLYRHCGGETRLYRQCGGETTLRPFSKKSKFNISLHQ